MEEKDSQDVDDESVEREMQTICDIEFSSENKFMTNDVEKKPTTEGDESKDSDSLEPPIPLVLEPNHPMMQRFQAALKSHLLKQLDKITNQVSELENEIKMKEKDKEELGVELYVMQQEIYKQQRTLENCENTIDCLMKERLSLEESLKSKKMSWKEEMNCLNCAKKRENDTKGEFYKLSSLEKQMEKWKNEMESELTVSQRISEKAQYDKQKMIEEKRKMDIYLLKLMTAVSNYESEIRFLEGEIEVKLEEKNLLNQTLADAAADLQCLVTEQKRLLSAWNAVVNTINHRNLIYNNISKELSKCQEGFLSLNAEIESYKRSSAEEMKKSEKLAIIYGRLQNDCKSAEASFEHFLQKKAILEDKIASMAAMINRTEEDYQICQMDTEKIQVQLDVIKANIEKLLQEKRQAEDDTMNYLHDQIFSDKKASHLNKLLKDAREKSRKQEFSMLETENKISKKFLEIEELKETVSTNNEIIKEANTELKNKEEELKNYEDEISKCHSAFIQKQGNFANLMKKMEKAGVGKIHQSPLQLRIVELEKLNAEIQAKNDKLQSFWLIQQNNSVKITQQRNEQLKNISLLRRQVLLLEQRALKIDVEFERERKIENDVNKSILQLQYKLTVLNDILVGKKGYKENLDKKNSLVQAQYLQNLKDAESEQIRLKAEIKDLETNLEELAETMLSVQREMLAWEKKIQSAVEAKNDLQKERSGSGEVGQMKAEIHRMEVRFGQLKKVQERLITDLEQCVLRRDAIFDGADAAEKRQMRGFNTRFTIQKKIENLKNNVRAVCNEQKQIEKIIINTEEGHKELKKAISEKETQLLQMEETTKKMDQQLEEGKLHKCQNLEILIRRQKKCKLYELLKSGKHRMLFKSEGVLDRELKKVKNTNVDLISVIESLKENFPAYRFQLTKIRNSLQAKSS